MLLTKKMIILYLNKTSLLENLPQLIRYQKFNNNNITT